MSKHWFAIAFQAEIVKRSLRISLVVGSLLTLINNADVIWSDGVDLVLSLKVLLTYSVPYAVSTYASVSTVMVTNKQ